MTKKSNFFVLLHEMSHIYLTGVPFTLAFMLKLFY